MTKKMKCSVFIEQWSGDLEKVVSSTTVEVTEEALDKISSSSAKASYVQSFLEILGNYRIPNLETKEMTLIIPLHFC